jgi:hypothetical protein
MYPSVWEVHKKDEYYPDHYYSCQIYDWTKIQRFVTDIVTKEDPNNV